MRKTLEVGHRGAQKAYNQQDLTGLRDREKDRDRSGNIDINGIMNPYSNSNSNSNSNKNEYDRNSDYENIGVRGGGRGGGRNDRDYGSEDSPSLYHQYPDQDSYSQVPNNNNKNSSNSNNNSDYGSDGSHGNGFGNSNSNHSAAQNLATHHNQHASGEDHRLLQGLDQFDERKAKAKQMHVSAIGIRLMTSSRKLLQFGEQADCHSLSS